MPFLFCVQARRPARYSDSGWTHDPTSDSVSELLRIHWLRVIVDEGHSLGSLNITNAGALTHRFSSEGLMTPLPALPPLNPAHAFYPRVSSLPPFL